MTTLVNHTHRCYLLVIFVSLLWGACRKDSINNNFNLHAAVQLGAFSINGVAGDINQQTGDIVVELPFGTDLRALNPVLELPSEASSFPEMGKTLNFIGKVSYRVTNGNLYKDYQVSVKIKPPIKSFAIEGVQASIDHDHKSISLLLPDGTDLSALKPEIAVEEGVTVSPASGAAQDFSRPVNYVFRIGEAAATYQVQVISNSINEYAFLGTAADREMLSNPDEKAAADWFFATYPEADYVSFQSIESGRSLANYKVIWWHFDAALDLPQSALSTTIIAALRNYRANGGALLLTSFAARYVEALGVVPVGKGPNNVFGDFLPNGFIETDSDWGISFKGREDHPIFQGLITFEPGKAYLLAKGTFRLNHTAWWFLPEWGGYGNAATWREQTGGINLASEAWDDQLDGRVGIAEWPDATNSGNVMLIAFGAYDWYSEPENGGNPTNPYRSNIERLTKNAIDYLKNKNQ